MRDICDMVKLTENADSGIHGVILVQSLLRMNLICLRGCRPLECSSEDRARTVHVA